MYVRNPFGQSVLPCPNGFRTYSLPTVAVMAAPHAIKQTLDTIHRTEDFREANDRNLLAEMSDVTEVLRR